MNLIILAAASRPSDMPPWITQENLEKCATDTQLQESWEPKIGDWFFCTDLYAVRQITNLTSYYYEGDVAALKSDHGKDSRGHWTCDIYLKP